MNLGRNLTSNSEYRSPFVVIGHDDLGQWDTFWSCSSSCGKVPEAGQGSNSVELYM